MEDLRSFRVSNTGSIWRCGCDSVVDNPSVLIDGDVVIMCGDYHDVDAYYTLLVKRFKDIGLDTSDISMIRFNSDVGNDFTIKDICYILRRCMEFTASGFASNLRTLWGTPKFLDWLRYEEKRVPLSVE